MKDRLKSLGDSVRGALDTAWDQLPEFNLTTDVEIPVYVIHHGPDAEDYEILCDFVGFMTANQKGFLARPVLRVWAGRQDFQKYLFARRLREDFTAQFEVLRLALRAERESSGWGFPTVGEVFLFGAQLTGQIVAALLLWIATETGRAAIGQITQILRNSTLGKLVRGKSTEEQLEDLIDEKKAVIDEGLARLEITLHRDLYLHAWRGQSPGPMTGMDRDAWPLPGFVSERLD